ncbi:MAG: YqzL family protein [Clostridia bacterium]|nr:YqzL family protein [Clostridia bacterium]
MIKKIAWNTFKNTGNIDTMMELMEVENIEKNLKVENNGDSKDQRNCYFRK